VRAELGVGGDGFDADPKVGLADRQHVQAPAVIDHSRDLRRPLARGHEHEGDGISLDQRRVLAEFQVGPIGERRADAAGELLCLGPSDRHQHGLVQLDGTDGLDLRDQGQEEEEHRDSFRPAFKA
jgi:hypothetical protein